MSINLLKTPEETFDYLKHHDSDFKKMKNDSEYKSWGDFKNAFLKDIDLVKWLEDQIKEINDNRKENYSNAQLTPERRAANQKQGRRNVESGHWASLRTKEHQKSAGAKGKESLRKIRKERFELFMKFMMDSLPKEFTPNDIENIRINNLNNTLFHKSWKKEEPLKHYIVKNKFIDEGIKRNLIVKVQSGNQFKPTTFHKINEIHSFKNKENVVEQVKPKKTETIIKTIKYVQNSTYDNINVVYQYRT